MKIFRKYENLNEEEKATRDTIIITQKLLRSKFNKFDFNLAFNGLLCFVEIFTYNIYILIHKSTFTEWIFRTALAFLQLSLFFNTKNSDIFILLIFTQTVYIFYYLLSFFVRLISTKNLPISRINLAKIFLTIFHSATYFSNSFIIYESSVVRFLLQLLLLLILYDNLSKLRYILNLFNNNFYILGLEEIFYP